MLDDGNHRPGVTWLAAATALLPTLVVQEFTRIVLLPKLDKFYEVAAASLQNPELHTLHRAVHLVLGNAASVLPALIVLILLLEWIVKPSKRVRSLGAAMIAVAYNTAVLLGVVVVAILFAVTGPETSRSEPAKTPPAPASTGTPDPSNAR